MKERKPHISSPALVKASRIPPSMKVTCDQRVPERKAKKKEGKGKRQRLTP